MLPYFFFFTNIKYTVIFHSLEHVPKAFIKKKSNFFQSISFFIIVTIIECNFFALVFYL